MLPLGHPNLNDIDGFKKKRGQKIEKKKILGRERIFVQSNKKALKNHPRLYLYHQTLMYAPKTFNIT